MFQRKCPVASRLVLLVLWLIFCHRKISAGVLSEQTRGFWMWVDGSNHSNQRSIISAEVQYPGARQGLAVWIDEASNVWVYGGQGFAERKSGLPKSLDELWIFDVKERKWRRMGPQNSKTGNTSMPWPIPCQSCIGCSSKALSVVFVVGDKEKNSTSHTWLYDLTHKVWSPLNYSNDSKTSLSPRMYPSYWCDSNSGTLWVFGGSDMKNEPLNDMWKFTFKSRKWEKINYKNNKHQSPIARFGTSTWLHPSGDLYLFGGKSNSGFMQDLWVFSSKALTWKNLSRNANVEGSAGKYAALGVPAPENLPGGRKSGATWVDADGNLVLFGGSGYDAYVKNNFKMSGLLSDFWVYNVQTKMWIWIGGSKRGEGKPTYGVRGKPSLSNIPGPRESTVSFKYKNQFWMFGGGGHDVSQRDGLLNDLWVFIPVRSKQTDLPGDTINLPFGYKVAISLGVAFLAIVLTLLACYKEECKRSCQKRKRCRSNIKYEPVKVKMQLPSVAT